VAVKRANGERTGEVPFGYRLAADRVHLEALPAEQHVIAAIQQLRSEGLSIRSIAARLNADGIPARGSRWHATSVARLLRRECV